MKRVLLITEYIDPPYDEGIKKTVFQLYEILNNRYKLQVICRVGNKSVPNINCIKTNKLFISNKLKSYIVKFSPDTIIYFPYASTTFAGFLRHFIISSYLPFSKNILIALQPKLLNWWQKKLVKLIRPRIVLTPSPLLQKQLNKLGVKNELIALYTDLKKFNPVKNFLKKEELRKKFNIALEAYVVSHIGHFNEGRNLKSLIELQINGNQVLIVGSSSTPEDATGPQILKDELEYSGIIILNDYIEHIEEIYQLSDVYIFPVLAPNSSIGLPLSILEARACGLPVLTTDFGSLKYYLTDDHGAIFYSTPDEFLDTMKLIKMGRGKTFHETNVKCLNEDFMKSIIMNIEGGNKFS